MRFDFGIIGLMLGATHSPTMMGDRSSTMSSHHPQQPRSSIPVPGMYGQSSTTTSRMTNISSRIFSERVTTSRTTSIFKERVSTSKTSYSMSSSSMNTKVVENKMSPSLKARIPVTLLGRRSPSPLRRQRPSGVEVPVVGIPPPSPRNITIHTASPRNCPPSPRNNTMHPASPRNIAHRPPSPRNIPRSRVKLEKAKYEQKIMSTQVESRLPTSRTRKSLLPAPKSLPESLKSTPDSPCQSPTFSSPSPRSKNLLIGQRVGTVDGRFGTLKFKGKTHFSQGCVCGIVLDSPVGKNNGTIDGIPYFTCEPKHGIFIPAYKVNLVSPSGVTRLLETPPASPLSPRSDRSFGSDKESKSKIPGIANEKVLKTSRPKTLQVFQENKPGSKQSSFKQGNNNKNSTDGINSKSKNSDKAKSTSGSKLFQSKKVSPVQSKLVLPGWTGDKTPGSPKPTSRLPELRSSKCKGKNTTVTVAKDEITPEETAPAEKVRSKRTTPEQGSPSIKSAGYKPLSRGLTSRPSLSDLTQLHLHDVDTPLSTPSPLNHPDVLEGCVRVLNKTFDISETSPSSEEEELDVSCAVKPLPEYVRAPRTLDLTYDLTPEGLPSVTCFPSEIKHQATSTPITTEPRVYSYTKPNSPKSVKDTKQKASKSSPATDIPVRRKQLEPKKEEPIEYDEFLAVPSCLDTPTGKCRFDLLTPEEFEQALQECNLLYEEEEQEEDQVVEEPATGNPKPTNTSPDRFKPKIWESITVVEDDLLAGLDSTFAEPSFLVPAGLDWSMDEGSGSSQSPKRDEASADAEVPCLDKLPDQLSSPETLNGAFHGDLHGVVPETLKRDEDFGIAQGGAPMFPDDVTNNNNNVDFLVPEDTETDTSASASGLQLSWENMEVELGQRSDDQLADVAGAVPFQTVFDNDDDVLAMGSFSDMVVNDGEYSDRSAMDDKSASEGASHPENREEDNLCDRTYTCDEFPSADDVSQDSAMCDRTFGVDDGDATPQAGEAHLKMFETGTTTTTTSISPPKSDNSTNATPDSPMELSSSEPTKTISGPCDAQQDDVVAMDTVSEQQESQKTLCATVTVSGNDTIPNGVNSEGSSDTSSGNTMVEDSDLQSGSASDKTLKRGASPPSELPTVVQVESVQMTSPSPPHSIPTYTPNSSEPTSPSGKDDSKDNLQTKNLKEDSRLPRKRSLLQQPKPVTVANGSDTTKNGPVAAPSESKAKLPRQKSHEQKSSAKDQKKDLSKKSASSSAMESLSKKTYSPASWRSDKSATSSPSRSSKTIKPKTDSGAKGAKMSVVRSKIDTGRRASADAGRTGHIAKKMHASNSSCDLEPNSLSSSTRSMRSDMSSNYGAPGKAMMRLKPVRRSAIPIRKNRQSYMYRPGKPVNKVTQTLKKRDDKRRDRKTSTSSINSVESSQRADSRASLSSRPSSRSDVSPDAKPKKRPRQSVRKDVLFVHGKLNNNPPSQQVTSKSRLVKPSSSTIRKQASGDRGQHTKAASEPNGMVQIDAAPTRRPGHMSRSSMPSRRSVTGTDAHQSRIGRKPPSGTSKETTADRTNKLAKTKGAPTRQPDIVSPSLLSEINRLEALCEARTKELNLTRLQLKSNVQGFGAMSVLVQYLSHQLDAFSTPKLKQQLSLVQRQLLTTNSQIEAYEADISRLKYEIAAKEERHTDEVDRTHDEYKVQLEQLEESLQNQHIEQVESVKQQHRQQLDNSDLEHQNELSELAGVHRMAFREQEEQHIEQVTTIQQEHHDHIEEINREHQLQVEQHQAVAENEQRRLQDEVLSWKHQCESQKEKVSMLQEALKKDSDAKVQAAIAQYKHLPDEVESMRAVLEMKNAELHNLRIENMNLKKEVERIPDYQDRVQRLASKVEELQAIVSRKQDYQRQLSSEHIALRENYQRETNEKKRLSMENEELVWKLSQSCEAVSPGSLTPPRFNPSPSPTRPSRSFTSPASSTKSSHGFPRGSPQDSPDTGMFSAAEPQN